MSRVTLHTAITAALLAIGTAAVPVIAVAKAPIACGTTYTIERSDTLFRIAVRAYGDGWLYKRIFQANRDLLAEEASVEIGNELLIPCLDGAGNVERADALAQDGGGGESEVSDARSETEAPSLPQSAIDDGVTNNLWRLMTPEERALWQS